MRSGPISLRNIDDRLRASETGNRGMLRREVEKGGLGELSQRARRC
jgi:hypothetical protein